MMTNPNKCAGLEWVASGLRLFAVMSAKRELAYLTSMPTTELAERVACDHNAQLTASTGLTFLPEYIHQLASCARSVVKHTEPTHDGPKSIGYRTDKLGPLLLSLQAAITEHDARTHKSTLQFTPQIDAIIPSEDAPGEEVCPCCQCEARRQKAKK